MIEPAALTLVINTFNQPDYLLRVLKAVAGQTRKPGEVILADDGSEPQTRRGFEVWSAEQRFRTKHVWQERAGFRRARILNLAIAQASESYLVFLDGDTVPHPCFVSDHCRLAAPSRFVQGHRALIGKQAAAWFGLGDFAADRRRAVFTGHLRGLKHAYRWPWPSRRHRADLRGIRGCNLAIWHDQLAKVNGYNEAFVGWGREDSELAVRLMNSGVRRLDVRGWALCYHLWHPPVSREGLATNEQLLQAALSQHPVRCESGLSSHLSERPGSE